MSTEQQNGASPEHVIEAAQPQSEIIIGQGMAVQPQNIVLSIRGLDVLLNMSSPAEREQIQQKLQNCIDASISEKLISMASLVQQAQDTAGRESR